jgi:hypothetical protein
MRYLELPSTQLAMSTEELLVLLVTTSPLVGSNGIRRHVGVYTRGSR